MIIVIELLLLMLALFGVVALFFRVRCPPGHALVMTQRSKGSLQSGPPSFRVISGRGAFRTPSVGSVDLLDLNPVRVDAFVRLMDGRMKEHELHAVARIRVSKRTAWLRKAAVRVLGMPRRDMDAIGEGALAVAVRDAAAGHLEQLEEIEQGLPTLEGDARDVFGSLLQEIGMEVLELRIRIKGREQTELS